MGMVRKAREGLREVTWELKWKIRLELADPLGKAFYGCLALLVMLHIPLLVAGTARTWRWPCARRGHGRSARRGRQRRGTWLGCRHHVNLPQNH